jgi:hypothetical protein
VEQFEPVDAAEEVEILNFVEAGSLFRILKYSNVL